MRVLLCTQGSGLGHGAVMAAPTRSHGADVINLPPKISTLKLSTMLVILTYHFSFVPMIEGPRSSLRLTSKFQSVHTSTVATVRKGPWEQ